MSYELAVDALIEAWTRFDYTHTTGPIAVYQCEDCGNYHLTSQGKINETLQKHITSGKIQRQKEADRWIEKLKNR